MRALVTGGGGFLGQYIVEQLIARGDSVRVFCRHRHEQLEQLGVEWHQGNISDRHAVTAACAGMDCVFHVAALPGIWGPWKQYYRVNTQGTFHIIEACKSEHVPKLVYTSSPSVIYDGTEHLQVNEDYPYPKRYLCHYPHTKALAEKAVLEADGFNSLATVSIRPHLIWGPRDHHLIPRLIARAKSRRLRRVGDGQNLISMSYVENVAHAHLLAADALSETSPVAGKAYFINEPQSVKLWEWIDQLLAMAGLPPVTKSISVDAAYRMGIACEAMYRLLRLPGEPPMTRFLALQLGRSHEYDIRRAENDFGYQPIVSVEEGLNRLKPDILAAANA